MAALPTDKIISCFFDSSTDCVKVLDTSARLLSFNPNGLKVMEIDDISDVLGKDWLTFWQGDVQQGAKRAFHDAVNGQVSSFQGYTKTFKGTMKYWEVSIAPLLNEYGDVQWLLVTSHDASRVKELEQMVEAQQKEIDLLKNAVPAV